MSGVDVSIALPEDETPGELIKGYFTLMRAFGWDLYVTSHFALRKSGTAAQIETIKRLNTVPAAKARKATRAALRTPGQPQVVVDAVVRVLDDFGIQPAEKVEPLPSIALDDVRLIAWMAVEGAKTEPAPGTPEPRGGDAQ